MIENKKTFLRLAQQLLIVNCSLLICAQSAHSAVRVGNATRSNAAAYQQLNMMYNPVVTQNIMPIVVEPTLANAPADIDTAVKNQCTGIYPNGVFAWAVPTAGVLYNGANTQCTAVVEMRAINGTDDILLATANVAAGDTVDCNIDNFPESSFTAAAYEITFPADKSPTMDDVVRQMNQEQKKDAGLKIAAATVIGGVGGNLLSPRDPVTGKKDAGGTIIGALGMGGVMTASTYSGKVAGDVILSAGVNAAAGGIVGNIMASGNSVLRIEDCEIDGAAKSCLWGTLQKNTPLQSDKETAFYNIETGNTIVCDANEKHCNPASIIGIRFENNQKVEDAIAEKFQKLKANPSYYYSYIVADDTFGADGNVMQQGPSADIWVKIAGGGRPAERIAAMIPAAGLNKAFGAKMNDWYEWRGKNQKAEMFGRDNMGRAYELTDAADGTQWDIAEFYPVTIDADDGGVIDLGNAARAKSTAIGAGAGAGLGAFTAYQGATDEVNARWATAVTQYKDSLQKIYCATGTRFLSYYNDVVIIPNK